MGLVRRVCSDVIEHRIERCSQRLEFYNPGKQCAVADFGVDQECLAFRDLKRMKFRRRIANALFDLGRTRALEQLFLLNAGSRRTDLDGDFPFSYLFPFTQRGIGQRETNAIISEPKVLGRLGHAIRREPLRQTGIVPISVEHKWRTHHHSAARSEEHTSELQSPCNLVCRLLLEKKKDKLSLC